MNDIIMPACILFFFVLAVIIADSGQKTKSEKHARYNCWQCSQKIALEEYNQLRKSGKKIDFKDVFNRVYAENKKRHGIEL